MRVFGFIIGNIGMCANVWQYVVLIRIKANALCYNAWHMHTMDVVSNPFFFILFIAQQRECNRAELDIFRSMKSSIVSEMRRNLRIVESIQATVEMA